MWLDYPGNRFKSFEEERVFYFVYISGIFTFVRMVAAPLGTKQSQGQTSCLFRHISVIS